MRVALTIGMIDLQLSFALYTYWIGMDFLRPDDGDEDGALTQRFDFVRNAGGKGRQSVRVNLEPLTIGCERDSTIEHQHRDRARCVMLWQACTGLQGHEDHVVSCIADEIQ